MPLVIFSFGPSQHTLCYYLVLSIRPVVYGIYCILHLLHADIASYCIGTSHSYIASALMLPGPSLWLVSCCLHAVPQMRDHIFFVCPLLDGDAVLVGLSM